MSDREVTADELEPFAEPVDQSLVELLERAHLGARAIEDHDDDGEGGQKIEAEEGAVDHHIRRCPRLVGDEVGHDAVQAPEDQQCREESRPAVGHALRRPRPEHDARFDLGDAQEARE